MEIYNLLVIKKPIWLRIYDYIGRSKVVSNIGYYLSKLTRTKNVASMIYQTLTKRTIVLVDNTTEVAYVNNGHIYVNEIWLNDNKYGVKRWTMHHENIHIKNNDSFLCPMVMYAIHLLTMSVLYYTGCVNILRSSPMTILWSQIVCILSSLCWWYGWHKYIETRADIGAAKTIQCSQCVEEWRNVIDRDEITEGYLGKKELNIIIDHYKKQNKLCIYHKNNITIS
jgi:hypothetical protein